MSSIQSSSSGPAIQSVAQDTQKPIRSFKDNSKPIPYDVFNKTLKMSLGSYDSQASQKYSHNFTQDLLILIAEYKEHLITFPLPKRVQGSPTSDSQSLSLSPRREFVSSIGFGEEMWNSFFGNVGKAPPLPKGLGSILESPCPFFKEKTIEQTHILALIPETINEAPMNLVLFGEFLRNYKTGYSPNYVLYKTPPFGKSHWVLMTNSSPEEARGKSYDKQNEFVSRFNDQNYHVPKLSQAIVAIFSEFLATGICRYGKQAFTRCQEQGQLGQMMVGDFTTEEGLSVITYYNEDASIRTGMALVRKFT